MGIHLKSLNLVFKATFSLHNDLLNDAGFAGYEGTKQQFDDLYEQVSSIVTEALKRGGSLPSESEVLEAYWAFQTELAEGLRTIE